MGLSDLENIVNTAWYETRITRGKYYRIDKILRNWK